MQTAQSMFQIDANVSKTYARYNPKPDTRLLLQLSETDLTYTELKSCKSGLDLFLLRLDE